MGLKSGLFVWIFQKQASCVFLGNFEDDEIEFIRKFDLLLRYRVSLGELVSQHSVC